MPDWVIGVDVGGTFTDFAARNLKSGASATHKRPSTPDDPSRAIIEGLGELTRAAEIEPTGIGRFAHGTTVATNALLQRKGAGVAMITTAGFRDLMEIGRQVRPRIYDLQADAEPPLAPREHRLEAYERMAADGTALQPLEDGEIARLCEAVAALPVESVAVCFLFSFLNPAHEEAMAAALREAHPGLSVSVSSEVQGEFREFERFSTTLINAALQPVVGRYVERLEGELGSAAPEAVCGIFQSSGGLMTLDRAAKFPVRTALSGPAAGAVGAAAAAQRSGIGEVITLDMGGTSTDVCLVRDGAAAIANVREVAGFRIRLPMVDIHTVGAGGGSLAHIGPDGLMKVGPQSAGADPGPAAYARGGAEPTVSDANVVLGRLPTELAGGALTLDRDKAAEAIGKLAGKLDLALERAALGVAEIVASNMTRAIRAVSVERGHDPRAFTLMPFGGAGGLHAADVARALGMRRILVPLSPGILCAEGLIVADLQENFVAPCRAPLEGELCRVREALAELCEAADAWAEREAEGAEEKRQRVTLDMRYVGQNYELPVALDTGQERQALPPLDTIRKDFFAAHQQAYGHHDPDAPIEIVNLRLKALATLASSAPEPHRPQEPARPVLTQDVWFEANGPVATPVYDRASLPEGTKLHGPAIITQMDATTVVPPWARFTVDGTMNLLMEIDEAELTHG